MLLALQAYFIYYERIMIAEEHFLMDKFGEDYTKWAASTPLFIPRHGNYRKPEIPFSFRTVLKREYTTFLVIISSFFALEIIGEFITERKFEADAFWTGLFIIAVLQYIILFTLKKKTHLLDVKGR